MATFSFDKSINYWKIHAKENPNLIFADPIWNNEHFEWMNKEYDRLETRRSSNLPIMFLNSEFSAPFDAFKSRHGAVYVKNKELPEFHRMKYDLEIFVNCLSFPREFNFIRVTRKLKIKIFWTMIKASVKFLSLQQKAVERVNHPEAKRKRNEFEIVDDDDV